MDYQESVNTLLSEHLENITSPGHEFHQMLNCSRILDNGDYTQRVYKLFFNLINDPIQSPESIIHILGTYISGLDGFSTNKSIQTVVSFPCLEALARRRPGVLEGPWEKVAWIIVKYSALSDTMIGKALADFKSVDVATLKWIIEISSPELCPNPFLRLELFRLMRCFNFKTHNIDFDYDLVSFRIKIINTLFEVFENYSTFTIDQLPNFSPMDLQVVIKDNNINMHYIMEDCYLYSKRSDIIVAVLKLTRDLALLEKEKHQCIVSQAIPVLSFSQEGRNNLNSQISACLSFCGLLPHALNGYSYRENCLLNFSQAIDNYPLILNDIIFTLDTITQVSRSFPEEQDLHDFVRREKDLLLHRFFMGQISKLPKHQYLREIQGGFTPATEYRLRYLQTNSIDYYPDSENDSECLSLDTSEYGSSVSEEDNSEIDFSDEYVINYINRCYS